MKWLVAPNAFKGTIEADRAAALIEKAILDGDASHQVELCPIADGGDGTCHLLSDILGMERVVLQACGPLGRPIEGFFGFEANSKTAFVDVSTVSGIKWLHARERDPWTASSYGTGELILRAVDLGATEVVLGLGGSATVDLGTGILRALGFLFLDENGREIPVFSPGFLSKIAHIQQTRPWSDLKFTILCDVDNTYFGERGAIPVFGPQKGLKLEDFPAFEEASRSLVHLFGRKSNREVEDKPGFGAAGGIALGLSPFFETNLVSGARYFFDKVHMADRIGRADRIVTGEGRYDSQSDQGKGSHELLKLAKEAGKEIWLVTSGTDATNSGFDRVLQLPDLDFSAHDLAARAEQNLVTTLKQAIT
ncbi:Glycerate kinase [Lunatimonas lonarensis]|uniref:Glycerate kinase n=1 Tax=Lunatimonas lonarensis TaxID=1232681 RepID=R7ZPY7_9BACT|nr:glycerate kinase [Lunatimonas lonarensis]EON76152.1 Glycerate kinase [Lunatimonas lonarensis]